MADVIEQLRAYGEVVEATINSARAAEFDRGDDDGDAAPAEFRAHKTQPRHRVPVILLGAAAAAALVVVLLLTLGDGADEDIIFTEDIEQPGPSEPDQPDSEPVPIEPSSQRV